MQKGWAAWPRGIRWLAGGIAALVLVFAVAWVLFVPAADWLAHHDVGSVTGALHETALDNARGRLLTLGAGLLAGAALVFTALNFTLLRRNSEQADQWQRRTHELTEQGQVTDRYTKAIEQLGSKELDVRIGGIYALERIARDSARDHPSVMEVLTAFIREHSREQWPPRGADGAAPERLTRPDVQAALTVVGKRDRKHDIWQRSVDLTGSNLAGATLVSTGFSHAKFSHAKLTRANLHRADLGRADLSDADLRGANIRSAHLVEANLGEADLAGAELNVARLMSAYLGGANLTDAILRYANLTGAILPGANFTRANLTGANLTRANLTGGARLTGANLTGADLTRANLSLTDLTDAIFDRANLTDAKWPKGTPVPDGWELDAGTDRLRRAGIDSRPAGAD